MYFVQMYIIRTNLHATVPPFYSTFVQPACHLYIPPQARPKERCRLMGCSVLSAQRAQEVAITRFSLMYWQTDSLSPVWAQLANVTDCPSFSATIATCGPAVCCSTTPVGTHIAGVPRLAGTEIHAVVVSKRPGKTLLTGLAQPSQEVHSPGMLPRFPATAKAGA